MVWDNGLDAAQRAAARHVGSHARLLAGPGTGKTLALTRRICFLVETQDVSPQSIVAVTFTRAAARELRDRVVSELGEENLPRISTLHSFALRQLLRNANLISDLPQPLRIADDWEERNIILEDLKSLLGLARIHEANDRLNRLSADWQSLTADEMDWERRFPDPRFLGIWREHRQVYGYTLRAELVYQLRKVLEQRGDFEFEGPIEHLLVDEYQDLNRCDLAVVREITSRNVELFVAGDDDQSIYGFRRAHPEGIRRFPRDYVGASDLSLEICKRCDQDILDFGLFVAQQDPRRVEKTIRPEPDGGRGEVVILRFQNQEDEAAGIAMLCKHLIDHRGLRPEDILILLRSDHNGVFSDAIRAQIEELDLPVVAATEVVRPLDDSAGRTLLAFMRLAANHQDSLAWRTLFQIRCHGVGPGAIGAVYDAARTHGWTFAETTINVRDNQEILPTNHRNRVGHCIQEALDGLEDIFPEEVRGEHESCDELMDVVRQAAQCIVEDEQQREAVLNEFQRAADMVNATSIPELVRATEVSSEDIEQELEPGKVNILTMHKAKGLTAEAVIVAGAEDQYIPGRAVGEAVDDERRLLYVSLTRAKHHLFVTYCNRRTGQQRYTGRESGRTVRSLTRFLGDSPFTLMDGQSFISDLAERDR